MSELFIPSESIVELSVIAETVNLSEQEFIERSIGLGITLANMLSKAPNPPIYALFEQPEGGYERYPIDFVPEPHQPLSPSMACFEERISQSPIVPLALDAGADTSVSIWSGYLNIPKSKFVEYSLAVGKIWSATEKRNGNIYIQGVNTDPEEVELALSTIF